MTQGYSAERRYECATTHRSSQQESTARKDRMSISEDAADFLSSGGGPPSASFKQVGASVEGEIVRAEMRQKRDIEGKAMFWDNGDPQMQLVIWLQTSLRDPEREDDDGLRRLFASGSIKSESKSMRASIADAVRKHGPKTRLEVGGQLRVTYVGDGPRNPQRPALSPPKQYSADYRPPTPGSVSLDQIQPNAKEGLW